MYELIQRKHRREPMELQLTAMIDIFSMIVIFLIMGTVFGGADVPLPAGLKLPKSSSREISASGPSITISGNKVAFSAFGGMELELSRFQEPAVSSDPQLSQLKKRIKEFVANLPKKEKSAGALLNVVSDEGTPYRDIFNTVKFFRDAGFSSLLFVAAAERKAQP